MQLASRLTQLTKLSNATDHPGFLIFDIAALACAGHEAAKFSITADSLDIVTCSGGRDGRADGWERFFYLFVVELDLCLIFCWCPPSFKKGMGA